MPKRRPNAFEDFDLWYAPSTPRPVKNGIKARSQRGALSTTWWGKRWIGVLESFDWGSRLQRGRTYARQGQVRSITIDPGRVRAKVQGSRLAPYAVTIQLAPLTDAQWESVVNALAQQAIFAAQLLAGEMPQEIETAFAAAGVALFPRTGADLITECSCPDYANPCKHIAAVYYLLGERFDDDPFLLFVLRGRTKEQTIAALRSRRAATTAPEAPPKPTETPPALAEQLATFWSAGPELATIGVHLAPPTAPSAIVHHLPDAPAEAGPELAAIYAALPAHAIERVFGDEDADDDTAGAQV